MLFRSMVTEPIKPLLDTVVTSGAAHLYISQTDKGEVLMGGDLDGYNSYAQRGNLPLVEHVVQAALTLFPCLGRLRLMRTWGGVMDMTMDGSPIIARLPVKGLYFDGGWCYGGLPGSRSRLVRAHGRDAVMRYERACFETIDVIGATLAREGIDAHFHKGGWSTLAMNPVGLAHARAAVEGHHAFGHTDADYRLLSAEETLARTNVPGALGTVFCPHAARVHPARLEIGRAHV